MTTPLREAVIAELSGALLRQLTSRPDVRQACNTMLFARKLYAKAVEAVEQAVNAIEPAERDKLTRTAIGDTAFAPQPEAISPDIADEAWAGVPPTIADSVAYVEGRQECHSKELLQQLGIVLHWLETLSLSSEALSPQQPTLGRMIPVGLPIVDNGTASLVPGESLVLGSSRTTVKRLLEYAVAEIKKLKPPTPFGIVRLVSDPANAIDCMDLEFQNLLCFNLDPRAFRSWKQFVRFYQDEILPHLERPIELLIIDDLVLAGKHAAVAAASPARHASNVHKLVRKVAKALGCAVLAGLPLGEEMLAGPLDLSTSDWESLRLFSRLRFAVPNQRDGQDMIEIEGYDFAIPAV